MADVLTRTERQARTRQALIEAAREAFLDQGYEGASLAAIAAAAGCTTGAVYANFASKDELLAAVLDARAEESRAAQVAASLGGDTLEDAIRGAARELIAGDDPRWPRLIADYWARAAHDEEFRRFAARRYDAVLDGVVALLEELARRHAVRPAIPPREIARGAGALIRGLRLELALGLADRATAEMFEEMFLAYVRGLMRPAAADGDEQGAHR